MAEYKAGLLKNGLKTKVYNDFKQGVDIKSYTSADPYEAPNDGYLYLGVSAGGSALAWIKGSTSNYVVAMGGQPGFWSTFVRKGMKLYGSNNPTTLSFFELQ